MSFVPWFLSVKMILNHCRFNVDYFTNGFAATEKKTGKDVSKSFQNITNGSEDYGIKRPNIKSEVWLLKLSNKNLIKNINFRYTCCTLELITIWQSSLR